ncbi:hypothetical protein O4H52_10585 [Sphingomonadaceae bacterium G21617-S1]|jgi:hypothetical protein|uniref:hypothetical protein n=1 Tax=Rhizorhabdus sp. TaxID=1968843 RepID=UPI001215520F|nr:hypothetical protein [Rhizorhabdus sp.]MBD3759178.1 hypothetical protein [Rhizorhabdus sp.]MCZ4342054.1 hypothetical protein [Sphingomonadaceae bacterium G21617-S1]TAK06906.1 MAG: hypothetical protein EPO38_13540 [Rhizorhabdus sp.]
MSRWPILAALLLIGAAGPSPVDDAALGLKLAEYARRAGDARTMLVAARIVAASGLREGEIRDGQLVARESLPDRSPVVLSLIEEAKLMAPADAAIAADAAAIAAARPKGIIGGSWGSGPLQFRRLLPAGERIGWTVRARGAETVLVSAIGDGDADLHLSVADGRGRMVCDDRSSAYYPLCRWSPPRAAAYRIALGNAGKVPTQVVVLSN